MIKKFKQKRGFTLVELLAVIVILGVALTVAVPATTNYIQNYKEAAFFTNVQLIVNEIRQDESINEVTGTKHYSVDSERFQNVETTNVISYTEPDSEKRKYIVVSESDSDLGKAIVTEDFYTLSVDEKDEWVSATTDDEYEALYNKIIEKASESVGVTDEE